MSQAVQGVFSPGLVSSSGSKATINEDSGCSPMARVVGQDGVNILQAGITSITYGVRDVTDGSEIVAAGTALTVANVVFDTLQTDDRWDEDTDGYNFLHAIAASVFATGDVLAQIEYVFTPTSGQAWTLSYEVYVKALLGT